MRELELQQRILLALGSRPGVRIWRSNTGVAYAPLTTRGRAALAALSSSGDIRPIRYGVPGQADLTGILAPSGQRLELEVKSPSGRARIAQKAYASMVAAHGGRYAVVRSVADALAAVGIDSND